MAFSAAVALLARLHSNVLCDTEKQSLRQVQFERHESPVSHQDQSHGLALTRPFPSPTSRATRRSSTQAHGRTNRHHPAAPAWRHDCSAKSSKVRSPPVMIHRVSADTGSAHQASARPGCQRRLASICPPTGRHRGEAFALGLRNQQHLIA